MDPSAAGVSLLKRYALPLCLLIQAVLLLPRLDLLPVWGDEHFTLQTAAKPLPALLDTVRQEVNNPPLHPLLVHFWLRLPLPGSEAARARALSVLFVMMATVLLDRLWLRTLSERCRLLYLCLWCLSPYLLLYSRMARSYTIQAALFCVALWIVARLLAGHWNYWLWLAFALVSTALLYVHYLPGIAVIGASGAVLPWKAVRERQPKILGGLAASCALIAVLFLPWILYLHAALGRVARASAYAPFDVSVANHALRVAYLFFSFNFGETPAEWVVAGAVLLAPFIVVGLWRAAVRPPAWGVCLALATVVGYFGAFKWVSFAFIPARLVYVYPFYLLLLVFGLERAGRRLRTICLAGLVCLSAASIFQYLHRESFLNKAYLMPYEEAAELIQATAPGPETVVIVDTVNNDPGPLISRLPKSVRVLRVTRGRTLESLFSEINARNPQTIWFFRNTHDVSPGQINRLLEERLSDGRQVRVHRFLPYSRFDRWMMAALGWSEQPSHVIQLLEMRTAKR